MTMKADMFDTDMTPKPVSTAEGAVGGFDPTVAVQIADKTVGLAPRPATSKVVKPNSSDETSGKKI